MCGIWLYEIADLTGMKKADIEHVKAFASRKVDRARPAYGRFRVDRPRRTVFFATTNDDEYLKSQTGNRRFWPVPTTCIDLDGLSSRPRPALGGSSSSRSARLLHRSARAVVERRGPRTGTKAGNRLVAGLHSQLPGHVGKNRRHDARCPGRQSVPATGTVQNWPLRTDARRQYPAKTRLREVQKMGRNTHAKSLPKRKWAGILIEPGRIAVSFFGPYKSKAAALRGRGRVHRCFWVVVELVAPEANTQRYRKPG